jgi:tetratricopeptide (TPR) repeat protein
VLGAAGDTFGLGFFRSRQDFERLHTAVDPQSFMTETQRWLFTYDEVMDWPIADSELWEEHGLPVAGPRAYPSLVCHQPGRGFSTASAEQLAFVESLLRALAATTEDEMDGGRWSKVVRVFDEERNVGLSLPDLLVKSPRRDQGAGLDRGTLPDRRLMERTMVDFQRMISGKDFESVDEIKRLLAARGGKMPPHRVAQTPEERAQDLVYTALESEGRLRVKWARQALALWPDCAEAWVIRAEEMPDLGRRTQFYREAVTAAERVLGPKPFAEDVGHFWGQLETRPYMRARNGLAGALWATGERDEAIAHWLELLRLNPADNQGVRDIVVPRLLELGRDAEAEDVLAAYSEDTLAMLSYGRALVAFRRGGDHEAAQAKLAAAVRANPHVIKYLAGGAGLPDVLPESYRPGSDDEAQLAAALLGAPWRATEGAVEWLRRWRKSRKKALEERRRRAKSRR